MNCDSGMMGNVIQNISLITSVECALQEADADEGLLEDMLQ